AQARVRANGREGRFDDVAGRGFMIVARNGDPSAALSRDDRAFWSRLGGRVTLIGDARSGGIEDLDGTYAGLMDEYGCDVILKRPDFTIFGACRTGAELPGLFGELRRQLSEAARAAGGGGTSRRGDVSRPSLLTSETISLRLMPRSSSMRSSRPRSSAAAMRCCRQVW